MADLAREFRWMRRALDVAESALQHNEVPIGCVFVLDDTVIASGFNRTNISLCGIKHAELVAIEAILAQYHGHLGMTHAEVQDQILANCEIYVTVEPCIMCASALRQLQVKKVVFGCCNDRFGGNGTVMSCNRGLPTVQWPREYASYPGILQKEAVLLLRRFYMQQNAKAPEPKVKKKRVFKQDDIPPIRYADYVSRDEFVRFYGAERLDVFEGRANEIVEVVAGPGHAAKKRRTDDVQV